MKLESVWVREYEVVYGLEDPSFRSLLAYFNRRKRR